MVPRIFSFQANELFAFLPHTSSKGSGIFDLIVVLQAPAVAVAALACGGGHAGASQFRARTIRAAVPQGNGPSSNNNGKQKEAGWRKYIKKKKKTTDSPISPPNMKDPVSSNSLCQPPIPISICGLFSVDKLKLLG